VTLGQYALGILLLAAVIVPLALGARAIRMRLLPGWNGTPAAVADAVIALSLGIAVAELLGLVGAFARIPVVLGCAAAGAGAWLLARRRAPEEAASPRDSLKPAMPQRGAGGASPQDSLKPAMPQRGAGGASPRMASTGVAIGAIAIVTAEWVTRVAQALDRGMNTIDTLWYHLPVAARFAHEGSITGLHFVDSDPVTAFYPASSTLLHGIGMLAFRSDVASPFLNLAWLALAFAAAWAIGRPRGLGPAAVVAVALVLGSPAFVATQPGGAYNDISVLALFLAAIALIVNGAGDRRALVIAGMAIGLGVGMKYTMLAPAAALTVGIVALAPRGERVRVAVTWLIPVVALGVFWYLRNLIAVGNPLPSLDLPLLPSPPSGTPTFTVAQYLTDGDVWRDTFLPGLEKAFGPAWWALIGLAAVGLLASLASGRSRVEKMLGLVGIAAAVAFVVTPQFLGIEGNPIFFPFNLRYASPSLALGLVLLALLPPLARPERRPLVLGLLAALLLVTQLDPALWPTDLRDERFAEPVRGMAPLAGIAVAALFLAGAGAVYALRRSTVSRQVLAGALAGVAVLGLAAGWVVQRAYMKDRYVDLYPAANIYNWARETSDARIATVGLFLQYPLYGEDLSNTVQYVGRRGPHGAFSVIDDCAEWRRTLNDGRYRYVVTAPAGFPDKLDPGEAPEARWTRSDPAATELLRDARLGYGEAILFRLDGPLDPAGCS
jgi:hypothetical protein